MSQSVLLFWGVLGGGEYHAADTIGADGFHTDDDIHELFGEESTPFVVGHTCQLQQHRQVPNLSHVDVSNKKKKGGEMKLYSMITIRSQ